MFELVINHPFRYLGQNLQEIMIDEVRLGHTPSHISQVVLLIDELEPFTQVFQTEERVVSQLVGPIVANTA